MNPDNLLSIRNVSNVYTDRRFGILGKKEKKQVLNNINLDIRKGEIIGLTGKSGCGKTTLTRCILGLINYEGEIIFSPIADNSAEKKVFAAKPQIQMIFQDPGSSLNPVKNIGWLMEEPLHIHKTGTKQERSQKTDEMLLRVGLDPSYKKRRVHELSGGQKQRVCIGRALILEPHLLIADEAISSLDVSAGAQILNLFNELHEKLKLNILFISHNRNAVEYLCGRIAVMEKGSITGVL